MDEKFIGTARKSESKAKQHMRGKTNGPAFPVDSQTPTGDDRVTMLISMTAAQKKELQLLALESGKSVAAVVREALIETGRMTPKAE